MMFSSNQKLKVSGPTDIEYIKAALDFVMKYSGQIEHTTISEVDRGCLTVFQITETGSFCIGWGFKKVPDDWREFPFKFDSDIVARIIKQHLEERSYAFGDYGDASVREGFLMHAINDRKIIEKHKIKNAGYGIVEFEPYEAVYAK